MCPFFNFDHIHMCLRLPRVLVQLLSWFGRHWITQTISFANVPSWITFFAFFSQFNHAIIMEMVPLWSPQSCGLVHVKISKKFMKMTHTCMSYMCPSSMFELVLELLLVCWSCLWGQTLLLQHCDTYLYLSQWALWPLWRHIWGVLEVLTILEWISYNFETLRHIRVCVILLIFHHGAIMQPCSPSINRKG